MVNDENLQRFYHWLQAKGDELSVVLALRWLGEFEQYAEEDEEDFRELKAWLKSQDDPRAVSTLRVVTWFEETTEPDPMLKRLHDWLQAKGNDPTAVLVQWWLIEFVEAQEEDCPQTTLMPTVH